MASKRQIEHVEKITQQVRKLTSPSTKALRDGAAELELPRDIRAMYALASQIEKSVEDFIVELRKEHLT